MFRKDTNTANCIHETIKNRLNPGNALYHSFKNKLILFVLCGSETWSLTLRVYENRYSRRYSAAIECDDFQIAVLVNWV
jgi:hypothetical protein